MKEKSYDISGFAIHKIMQQLVIGLYDMMKHYIIHRDLKLDNIMIHYPDSTMELINMNKTQKN